MKKKLKKIQESTSTRLISDADIKRPIYKVVYALIVIFLILMCMITILPTLWIFASGFKNTQEFIQVPPTIIPRSFEPEKVLDIWNKVKFVRYLKNSAIIIVGDLACTIIFNGMAGYVFSKLKPAGHKILYKIIFITMLLPTSMNMIPLYSKVVEFTWSWPLKIAFVEPSSSIFSNISSSPRPQYICLPDSAIIPSTYLKSSVSL